MFWNVSKGIKEFCAAMVANPHDWVQGEYYFQHRHKPDIRIWTANGIFFVALGRNNGLTLAEKAYVLSAIKLTMARRLTTPEAKEGA